MDLEATNPHSVTEADNVAVAGKALQDSFNNSFPLEKLLNKRHRPILSSARSDMVADILFLGLERIDKKFGTDVRFDRADDISAATKRGSFADAGALIQEILDSHRGVDNGEDKASELDALERRFATHFRQMASRIDGREDIYGKLWNRLYNPKIPWLARLGF